MGIENLIFRLVGISRQAGKPDEISLVGLKNLFSKARYSIKIVSGELPYQAYCSDGLVKVVKQALTRGCTIEIIASPSADRRSLEALSSVGVSVFKLPQWPVQHFAVVDGKHVRLENPHKRGAEERTQYIIYDFKYAKELENNFDGLKKQVDIQDLINAGD